VMSLSVTNWNATSDAAPRRARTLGKGRQWDKDGSGGGRSSLGTGRGLVVVSVCHAYWFDIQCQSWFCFLWSESSRVKGGPAAALRTGQGDATEALPGGRTAVRIGRIELDRIGSEKKRTRSRCPERSRHARARTLSRSTLRSLVQRGAATRGGEAGYFAKGEASE